MSIFPQTVIYLVILCLAIGLFFRFWPHRQVFGVNYLLLHQISLAVWVFCQSIESICVSAPVKIAWSQFSYLGFVFTVPFYFLFIQEYSNQIKISRRYVILMLVIPVLTLAAAFTNQWHHLLWTDFHWGSLAYNALVYDHGVIFYIYVIFLFILALWGFLVIFLNWLKSQAPFRNQLNILAMSGIFPVITGALYCLGVSPIKGLDYSSFGFLLTDIFLAWGLSDFQLLDLVPVAKNMLIKQFQDGMIILDINGRVVEINRKAMDLLNVFGKMVIGQDYMSVLPWKINLVKVKRQTLTADYCYDQEKQIFYQLQISPLVNKSHTLVGHLLVLRDISQSKQTEIQLKLVNEHLRNQITEINNLQEMLQEQATHDSLTNLHNRRLMDEILEKYRGESMLHNQPFSLLVMDVDHFKTINDDYGHQTGDEILVEIGKIITSMTRSSDFSCRLGGDEILLAMQNINSKNATEKAEEIRKKVEKIVVEREGKLLSIQTSIGAATFPDNAETIKDLIYWADQAMYRAKDQGGNRVVLASPELKKSRD